MPAYRAGHFTDPPRDGTGRPIPNASFQLYVPGTKAQPTYYTDATKTATVPPDPASDERGNVDIWPEPGTYEYWYDGRFIQYVTVKEDNTEDDLTLTAAVNEIYAVLEASYYTRTQVDDALGSASSGNSGLLYGDGPPANTRGVAGSFYIDRVNARLYGPKGETAWPSVSISLVGPKGDTGPPSIANITMTGVWSSTRSYVVNEGVSHAGLLYAALSPNTNVTPGTDTNVWTQITQAGPAGPAGTNSLSVNLFAWASGESYHVLTATYHSSVDVVQSATIRWPDGSAGTFLATNVSTAHEAVDAYRLTHTNTGATVEQPTVSRDAQGRVISQPALIVTIPGGT